MIFLVEVTGVNASGVATVFRFGTQTYCTRPSDTPASTWYDGRVLQPGLFQRDLFSSNQTTGDLQIGYGTIELANADGYLDNMLDYAFDGQPLKIYYGHELSPFSYFSSLLTATMDQPTFTTASVSFRVRDYLYLLDKALQATKYLGNNSLPNGAEGVVGDLKARPKPLVFGKVLNISPPQVNTSKLMYQVHDGAVHSIAVYDKGSALTAGTAHATYSALFSATPTAGCFDTWLAGGLFRLGATPTGTVTCDVAQTSSTSNHTAAQIIKAVCLRAGVPTGQINSADVTALDSAQSSELGTWVDSESKPLDVINQIKSSVGAFVSTDAAGNIRMAQLTPPSGSPVKTLTESSVLSVNINASADTERGIPVYRVKLKYKKMFTVQTATDLSGAAQSRVSELGVEYREVIAEDSSILTQYPLAPEMIRTSLIVSDAAATTEANRLLDVYKVRRNFYSVVASVVDVGEVDINQVVLLIYKRFGLSGGKLLRVMGLQPDHASGTVTMTLWG